MHIRAAAPHTCCDAHRTDDYSQTEPHRSPGALLGDVAAAATFHSDSTAVRASVRRTPSPPAALPRSPPTAARHPASPQAAKCVQACAQGAAQRTGALRSAGPQAHSKHRAHPDHAANPRRHLPRRAWAPIQRVAAEALMRRLHLGQPPHSMWRCLPPCAARSRLSGTCHSELMECSAHSPPLPHTPCTSVRCRIWRTASNTRCTDLDLALPLFCGGEHDSRPDIDMSRAECMR